MELEAARRHSKTIPHPFPSLQPWNWKWWKRLRDTNEGSRFEEQRRHGLPPVSWFFVSNTSARVLATVSILLRVVVKRSRSSRTRSQWPRWWASSAGRERSIFRCRESWATLLLATFHVAARRPFTAARSSLLDLRGPSPAAFFFFLFFFQNDLPRCVDAIRLGLRGCPGKAQLFFVLFFCIPQFFFVCFFRWRCSTLSLTTSTSIGHRPRPVKGSGERFSFPPPFMSSIEVNVSIINQGGPPASSSSSRSRRVSGSDRVTISAMQFPSKGLVNERIFRVSWSVFFCDVDEFERKTDSMLHWVFTRKGEQIKQVSFPEHPRVQLGEFGQGGPWLVLGWMRTNQVPAYFPARKLEHQSMVSSTNCSKAISDWFSTLPFRSPTSFWSQFYWFLLRLFFYWDSLIVQNYYSRNTHLF